jgi:membrane protein CcdC involved in cytochrome C biogenesis
MRKMDAQNARRNAPACTIKAGSFHIFLGLQAGFRHEEMQQMLPFNPMSVVGSLAGMAAVLVWRVREGRTAVTLRKIVIPPLGMATGFCMFLVPAFRIPLLWAVCAFLIGAALLAYPLLRSSRLVQDGESVMMQRSNSFFLIVIALAMVRMLARGYIDTFMNMNQTAALFFVLAFGMILRWRLSMFLEYRQLTSVPVTNE